METTITRTSLVDGSLLKHARLVALQSGLALRSDIELAHSLKQFLSNRPAKKELWVFAYGSLMWNPAFRYEERHTATLRGWNRRLCLRSVAARGTPECPGLFLALEEGEGTQGLAFRLPQDHAEFELSLIWCREMMSYAYQARWIEMEVGETTVEGITFTADQEHPLYVGHLTEKEIADAVANATGYLGSCSDYVSASVNCIRELGLRDKQLERLNDMAKRVAQEG